MKLPRDVSGAELIKKLKPWGYEVIRQVGSHIRLCTFQGGEHHVTVPYHNPIRIGTLNTILNEVAEHFSIPKAQLVKDLFH